jgi:hypothetical protein
MRCQLMLGGGRQTICTLSEPPHVARQRRRRRLGNETGGHSGHRVSPLCLGAMTFGKGGVWGSEPEEAKRILDAYIAQGGNFIDTASGYTKGHSEAIIGEHLAHDRKKRDRVAAPSIANGGTTVSGVASAAFPMAPEKDRERW